MAFNLYLEWLRGFLIIKWMFAFQIQSSFIQPIARVSAAFEAIWTRILVTKCSQSSDVRYYQGPVKNKTHVFFDSEPISGAYSDLCSPWLAKTVARILTPGKWRPMDIFTFQRPLDRGLELVVLKSSHHIFPYISIFNQMCHANIWFN